jgi:predicted 3-demethylubiquinone-9 3-methyltransferase (glyoxalase superfamily)
MATMQKITPNLWFDNQAEEAARYYVSIFKNSKIGRISYYGSEGQEITKKKPGEVLTIEFELDGQQFLGLNAGPMFKFSEAISFIVYTEDQEETDYYWNKLKEGGDPKAQVCGWLKDKYGLSWQIVPSIIPKLISDPDRKKAERVMNAVMQMKKLDIKTLEEAAKG